MIQARKKHLEPRRQPRQDRSIQRAQQIMDVTAQLLDEVGFDDLTTILIAKELGISVGAVYHYFPNKHAILRAIAENWLKAWDQLFEEIDTLALEHMALETCVVSLTNRFVGVYHKQKGILPLVQAMFAVPELRDLDERHDDLIISRLSIIFKRMGLIKPKNELGRLARVYLEMTHALLLVVTEQKGARAQRTLDDLNVVSCCLLERHFVAV
ncbi:MAG: TetR/AcrR family transcriptional regulator [Pseudomonadales bacterium]